MRIQITATQIIVRWVFDHTGGVAVTEVLVELRTGNSQEYEVAPGGNLTDSESSETMLSIPGGEFLAGVEYQFRVTATNVIGPSLETESVTTAAPIGTANGSPIAIFVVVQPQPDDMYIIVMCMLRAYRVHPEQNTTICLVYTCFSILHVNCTTTLLQEYQEHLMYPL